MSEAEIPDPLRSVQRADAGGDSRRPQGSADDVASRLRSVLPRVPNGDLIQQYRNWDADSQRRALDLAESAGVATYRKFYCRRQGCNGMPHDEWEWNHARADQHPPRGNDWFVWLVSGGRGSGKTLSGSRLTHVMSTVAPRIALVAPTGADVRDTMVEGVSGILATASPDRIPRWEPSKRRLTWPATKNVPECIATTFSGEEPDRLRGPQFHWAWVEEGAHMPLITDVWSNLLLGLRLGKRPRIVVTTTPTPIKWMKDLEKDPLTVTTRVSTYANLANLAEPFKRNVLERYEGTRLGKQELHGEVLEDVEGALWNWNMIEPHRVQDVPDLDRIVVAIDPAGTARTKSDETGIIVIGIAGKHLYILADGSGRMSPNRWATTAINLYEHWSGDAIIAEKNYGGDMVKNTLKSVEGVDFIRVVTVTSRRGKALRAEPISSMYEQGRVHHVGLFPELEDQMVSWVPGDGDSPDRIDALVHGATNLVKAGGGQGHIANPAGLKLVVNQ